MELIHVLALLLLNKTNIILMKKVITHISLLILLLGTCLTACTRNASIEKDETSRDIILIGRDIKNRIKVPLRVDSTLNIYSKGDTVWAYNQRIVPQTWSQYADQNSRVESYKMFIIDTK